MAWRNLLESIVQSSLNNIKKCVEEANADQCADVLVAVADAVYSPLKPVDAGLGEARRLASQISSLLANAFIQLSSASGNEALVEETYRRVVELVKTQEPHTMTSKILLEAGVGLEPAWAPEPREAVAKTLKDYVEPEEELVLRRRRREPRKPNPVRDIRKTLRDLGRRDPILARSIHDMLAAIGVPL